VSRLHYVVRRVVFAAFLVFVVSSGAMVLARLAPGDATAELLGEGASTATIQRERERLGLERPIAQEYLAWLSRAFRLDFGESFRYSRPVGPLVVERATNTAVLAAAALLLATAVGLPLGVVAARGRGWLPTLLRASSLTALSLPPLVLSIGFAWLAARTHWLPVGGMSSPGLDHPDLPARALDLLRHLVVPVLALAIPLTATLERLQGRAMARTLREPWVAAARARGVPELRLRWRHALPASLLPVAAVYGLIAGSLLSGSFAVEVVTAWPGLGRLMYEALLARDVNLVAGCAAAGALFVAAGTLASDLTVIWLDPRIEEGS
jgi:peptide/nickel transport system permease protein